MSDAVSRPLIAGFTFLLLLTLLGAGVSLYSMGLLREQMERIVASHTEHLDRVHEMRTIVRERMLRLNWMFLEQDPFVRDRMYEDFLNLGNRFIAVRSALAEADDDPRGMQALDAFRRRTMETTVYLDAVVAHYQEGRYEAGRRLLLDVVIPAQERVIQAAEVMHAFYSERNAAAVTRARQSYRNAFNVVAGLSAAALLLVLLTAGLVITRSLADRRQLLAEIATRQRTEDELRALGANLETLVAERTAALRQTSDRLHEAERIGRMGHWEWDIASGAIVWSDEIYRIFGQDAEHYASTYEAFLDAVHPDDRGKIQDAVACALHEGEYQVSHRIIRPDGTVHHVQERARTIYDAAGEPQRMIGTVRDISEEQRLQQQLWNMAHHDPLTGLPNRGLLLDRLQQALNLAERQGDSLAVALIDLDRFKQVNDELGHAAGDRLLVELASRLRTCVRQSDTVARLAGDEFVGIFPGIGTQDEAAAVMDKICTRLGDPFDLEGTPWTLTTSIGVAFYPTDARDAASLLRAADEAMYGVKHDGRNGYAFVPSRETGPSHGA